MLKFLKRIFGAADTTTPPSAPRRRGVIMAGVETGSLFDRSVRASERFWRERHLRQPSMPLIKSPAPLRTEDRWLREGGSSDPEAPRIENGKPRYFG